MSQTVAFVLPLPVALALVVVLFVLLVLSAVALSLRKPGTVRDPARDGDADLDDAAAFRLACLHIESLSDLSAQQRRTR